MSIKLTNVGFNFGTKEAVRDVSMSVQTGQFTALIGPNGAGKSTIFHMLCGLLFPYQGSVEIAGYDMSHDGQLARKKLGLVFQQNTLDLELSVEQNLKYFAAVQGLDRKVISERIEKVLAQLNVQDRRYERVQNLNGGHRRRVEIARALLHEPKVLILDEPTVGLDRASKIEITKHAHELAKSGTTVLWITHLLDELMAGDNVIVLEKGKVVERGEFNTLGAVQTLEKFLIGSAS